ncbi:MAG: hypothetical protein WAT09_09975 [Paracoccaceae bacterium]
MPPLIGIVKKNAIMMVEVAWVQMRREGKAPAAFGIGACAFDNASGDAPPCQSAMTPSTHTKSAKRVPAF